MEERFQSYERDESHQKRCQMKCHQGQEKYQAKSYCHHFEEQLILKSPPLVGKGIQNLLIEWLHNHLALADQ